MHVFPPRPKLKRSGMEVNMLLFIFILFFLLLYRASASEPGLFQEDHFTKDYELPLRGFFTLVIVYHHLSQYLTEPGPFLPLQEAGLLCVAIFFFYSGYGVMKNALAGKSYFHHYFVRRYSKIFVPFYLCNMIYLAVYFFTGERFGLGLSLKYLLGIRLINPQSWYIIVIALFYLVFFLCFHLIRKPSVSLLVLAAFQIAFPTYCMVRGPGIALFQGDWWFNSSSLFLVGVILARYEDRIMAISRKSYLFWLGLSALLFLFLFPASIRVKDQIEALLINEQIFVKEMLDNWISFIWQTLAVISFTAFVFLLTLKIRFSNRFLIFLGNHSFELYLIHGLFLEILRGETVYVASDFLYTLLVLSCSLAACWALHTPFRFLTGIPGRLLLLLDKSCSASGVRSRRPAEK